MAITYFKGALLACAAFIVYAQVKNWLRWRALKKWGEQFGCGDTIHVPNKLPGGIERYALFFMNLKGIDILEDIIRARYKEMGRNTYRIYNPFNSSQITTAEPANVQAILATKFHDFDLGPVRRDNFYDMLGNGIFTAEGESWAHFRHQIKPQFTRDQISDLESADKHLQVLFKVLPEENGQGWIEKVNIMPMFYRFTMDVSTEFLFGQSVNSQSTALHSEDSGNTRDLQGDMDFADAMNFAQEYVAWRLRLNRLYWIANSKKFQQACKTVKEFADKFVQRALDPEYKRPKALEGQKEKYVLLDELVAETRDPVELRDHVLHLLLAGRDTTSALLSWTILLLSRHPEEFKFLRQVIIQQFGTETHPAEELSFESIKACKPLIHVLYETLRLYPLVPLNGRTAQRDTFLPLGGGKDGKQPVAVRKGEQVGYSSYVMHRRKDIWGEDSDDFRPGRWEGRKLGWEFIAFSGGPRVCLGQQFALNEAGFVVAKILQRYDQIEALDMVGKLTKGLSVTLSPGDGVNIKMHRAAS